jgi:hypothetical protein
VRVVVNTPAELVARHRPRLLPWLPAALALALALRAIRHFDSLDASDLVGTALGIVTALAIAILMGRRSEFRFDADTRQLTWMREQIRSRATGSTAIDDIIAVSIETNQSGDSTGDRVVLVTDAERLPLTWHYSGIEPHRETAQAIRVWLRDHGVRLQGDPE